MEETSVPSQVRGDESVLSEALRRYIARTGAGKILLEHEVKRFLKEIGFTVPRGIFVAKGEALPSLGDLRFPLVAKVSSPAISSKSDVRGVRLGLMNETDLAAAFRDLLLIPDAQGVLVEQMARQGVEVVMGGIIDRQFGPVVMFGLGGVTVELFKDVSFGLAPLKREDALWLVRQVRAYRLLEGYRGSSPADLEALAKMLITISEITATGLVQEINLNPVMVYTEGAMILDAKMVLVP